MQVEQQERERLCELVFGCLRGDRSSAQIVANLVGVFLTDAGEQANVQIDAHTQHIRQLILTIPGGGQVGNYNASLVARVLFYIENDVMEAPRDADTAIAALQAAFERRSSNDDEPYFRFHLHATGENSVFVRAVEGDDHRRMLDIMKQIRDYLDGFSGNNKPAVIRQLRDYLRALH